MWINLASAPFSPPLLHEVKLPAPGAGGTELYTLRHEGFLLDGLLSTTTLPAGRCLFSTTTLPAGWCLLRAMDLDNQLKFVSSFYTIDTNFDFCVQAIESTILFLARVYSPRGVGIYILPPPLQRGKCQIFAIRGDPGLDKFFFLSSN